MALPLASAKYASLSAETRRFKETNDCGVKAVAAATGASYSDVHARFAAKGRKRRSGVINYWIRNVLVDMGYGVGQVPTRDTTRLMLEAMGKTGNKTLTVGQIDKHPEVWQDGRTYLIFTPGHVACVVDGVVHDWTRGRRNRIEAIWLVCENEDAVQNQLREFWVEKQKLALKRVLKPTKVVRPQPSPDGIFKWQRCLALLQKDRMQAWDIAASLGISENAARGLVGDLRRMGYRVDKNKAGYFAG